MTGGGTEPGRPRVLLVEDHEDSRVMYAEFLRDGCDVHQAADGEVAWGMLRELRPDVVVTDLSLPRVDGFELIARMRGDEALRGIPIIALSGYSSPRPPRAGQGSDAWDIVLQKPCLPERLLEAVAEITSGRHNRG